MTVDNTSEAKQLNQLSPKSQENIEGIWVTPLSDECLDDVVPPPGGGSRQKPSWASESKFHFIPRPAYLSHEGRDLRIDLLRGYFVFSMIVDHVRGPSPLYLLTGGNRFFTSAAEGFILTSGLVAGIVYQRLIKRDGLGHSLYKVLSRTFTLYLLTVGLTLSFIMFSELLNLPWSIRLDLSDPLSMVLNILTLHRTYYLVDVLVLYTILFLVSPLAFILLDRGKTWILLLGSGLIYVIYQVYPDIIVLPWTIQANYLFNFSSWQILFFFAMALGFHQHRLPSLACRTTRIGLWVAGIVTAGLIAWYFLVDPPTSIMPSSIAVGSPIPLETRLWVDKYLFDKMNLRPGRLAASVAVFSFLFFAITNYWGGIRKWIGWLLLPLGQYALNAYTWHIIAVSVVGFVLMPYNIPYPGPQWLNASIQIISVLVIWFILVNHWFTPTPQTRKIWYAAPAAISVISLLILFLVPVLSQLPAARLFEPRLQDPTPTSPLTSKSRTRFQPTPKPTLVDGMKSYALPGSGKVVSPYLADIKGILVEQWFRSEALERDMPFYVYLPPDYDSTNRRYPVLYMLHGRGGNRENWVEFGLINAADQLFTTGNLRPMIIVLPQGESGYWCNHTGDGPKWGDYIYDIVDYIDAHYRTVPRAGARAIGGLSMGGWGALHHAFTRPDVFSVVGAHSPAFRPDDGSIGFLGRGEEYKRKDPMELSLTKPGIGALQIWVDTGDQDPWVDRAKQFHFHLLSRGINHVWQIYPGEHATWFWHEHSLDYIRFYGLALMKR